MYCITISELGPLYKKIITSGIQTPLFVWGAPGIGKSQVIHEVATAHKLPVIDVRLSQLAPSDIRGLPALDHSTQRARFYPPDFLPHADIAGAVLFLDEFNQAPPAMQGIVQQLVLDRRVGDYRLPDSVHIVAAGNRKQDRASVFDLTAPMANRFMHVEVASDLDAWRKYAARQGVHEQVLAFLGFRGDELLHQMALHAPAWPSPRSWMMASTLHAQGLSIALSVGQPCASEFEAFLEIYATLPNIDAVLQGQAGLQAVLPKEPSARWATITALVMRAQNAQAYCNGALWLLEQAGSEWLQRFFVDALPRMRELKLFSAFAALAGKDKKLKRWLDRYVEQFA
jgi:MoxR-like ATPase